MTETVLVVNAGSSSIKFQLFSVAAGDQLERRLKGQIEGVGVKPHLIARGVKGENLIDETRPSSEVRDVPAALDLARWSRVPCYVVPTDEELMIARHTLRVMYAHNAAMLEEKRP